MAAAPDATMKAPASPAAAGMNSYRRVAAKSASMPTPIPTPVSATAGVRYRGRSISHAPAPSATAATTNPMSTRSSGPIQPRLNARLRKKTAPRKSAMPPAQASRRPLSRSSSSAREKPGSEGWDGSSGGAGRGAGSGATAAAARAGGAAS
jgi:hypothetical protein